MRFDRGLIVPIGLAILLAGCDLPSSLLSESERNSIYTFTVEQNSKELAQGSALLPGASVGISLGGASGVKAPESLTLSILDATGASVATLTYEASSSRSAASPADSVVVEKVFGDLPEFRIPEWLPPGSYRLSGSVETGSSGAQSYDFSFFVPSREWELGGVAVSPTVAKVGESLLFVAAITPRSAAAAPAPAEGEEGAASEAALVGSASAQPALPEERGKLWLRWSWNGKAFAEGPVGGGLDKAVWRVPVAEGAYSVRLDFYPGPPSEGVYKTDSPWYQTITLVAKADPAGSPVDPFSRPDRFHSLFTFDGDLGDSGSRAQTESPSILGSPGLAAYSGGFGYRLGPEAGISVRDLGFDASERGGRFSVILRFSLESTSGKLLSLLDSKGGGGITLGVDENGPWLEYPAEGQTLRASVAQPLGRGGHDLELSFRPAAEGTSLTWTIDGGPRIRSTIAVAPAAFDRMVLGGEGAALAIEDGIGLCYDDVEPPPALLASTLFRRSGPNLLAATGFEGAPGDAFVLKGKGRAAPYAYQLPAGSRLSLAAPLDGETPLHFAVSANSGGYHAEFAGMDGKLLFTVSEAGLVADSRAQALGSLAMPRGRLDISVAALERGIGLGGLDGKTLALPISLPDRYTITLVADSATSLDSLAVTKQPSGDSGS